MEPTLCINLIPHTLCMQSLTFLPFVYPVKSRLEKKFIINQSITQLVAISAIWCTRAWAVLRENQCLITNYNVLCWLIRVISLDIQQNWLYCTDHTHIYLRADSLFLQFFQKSHVWQLWTTPTNVTRVTVNRHTLVWVIMLGFLEKMQEKQSALKFKSFIITIFIVH